MKYHYLVLSRMPCQRTNMQTKAEMNNFISVAVIWFTEEPLCYSAELQLKMLSLVLTQQAIQIFLPFWQIAHVPSAIHFPVYTVIFTFSIFF